MLWHEGPAVLKVLKTIKTSFVLTIPVVSVYVFVGIAFGFLLYSKGYGVEYAGFMSSTVFAGAMQFVAVGLLAEPFSPLYVCLITFMVNARHIFYGFSMLEKYRDMGRIKPYLIFGMTDETFAILFSYKGPPPEGVTIKGVFFFTTLLNNVYWVGGSIVGGLLGNALLVDVTGVEFLMPALFSAIVVEQMRNKQHRIPCIIGFGASLACLLIFGREGFMLPAMIMLVAVLTLARRPLEKDIPKENESSGEDMR